MYQLTAICNPFKSILASCVGREASSPAASTRPEPPQEIPMHTLHNSTVVIYKTSWASPTDKFQVVRLLQSVLFKVP
jgi:hypothetical protein